MASVNSETLSDIRLKIDHLYQDLQLTTGITIRAGQPVILPIPKPSYPASAGDESSRAVVVYGLGGIGKTTLAPAVIAKLTLEGDNYARVEIDEVPERNNFKSMQEQILKDAFPNYFCGRELILRDCTDCKHYLTGALKYEPNKPLFLFIDNALRAEDLKQLLPEDLKDLPSRSRILVTTRILGVTDMLTQYGLPRYHYLVSPLPDEDAEKILFNQTVIPENMKDDMHRITGLCNGIPLVLKLVGARLHKHGYRAENCSRIFEALEEGTKIREDNLSRRLLHFVYDELEESTKEAFLDICCFFHNFNRRHVEHIVGSEEVAFLEEAALITTVVKRSHEDSALPMTAKGETCDQYEGRLIVHDVIRAMGRSLSHYNRIMDLHTLSEAVQDQTRINNIKGIWLIHEKSKYELEEGYLNSMRKSLRVLALGEHMSVSARSSRAFNELRFIFIGGDIPCFPVNVAELDKLGVFHGPIFKEGFSMYNLPRKLRVIYAAKQVNVCRESEEAMQPVLNSSLEELRLVSWEDVAKLSRALQNFTAIKILRFN